MGTNINIIESSSKLVETNNKKQVNVSHPVTTSNHNQRKKVYNDSDSIASDTVSCSELTSDFPKNSNQIKAQIACSETQNNDNNQNNDPNNKQEMNEENNKSLQNEAEDVKYKAFVVMDGNKKQQTISNNIRSVTITNEDYEDNNDQSKEAIVLSHISNKIVSKTDEDTSNEKQQNKDNKMINPTINEVINSNTNLCANGIDDDFKLIKGTVVRSAKIQSIVKKMESYSIDDDDDDCNQINRNPVTHKFSTYYKRTERVGGTLLNTDDIATKYININVDEHKNDNEQQYISAMIQSTAINNEEDDNEEEEVVGIESENNNTNIRRSRRNQNHKKAKKYCAPPEELTRLEIREDIRKMRNPKMHEIKIILKTLGIDFVNYIDHSAYSFDASSNYQQQDEEEEDVYLDDDDDIDEEDEDFNQEHDDIQFIGMHSKHKKKKKKKRKHRHYNDYEQNRAFSISDNNNILNGHQSMNGDQPPHRKKQKIMNNNSEAIKCRKCNKIFTLEVDLLLHKTNDHC